MHEYYITWLNRVSSTVAASVGLMHVVTTALQQAHAARMRTYVLLRREGTYL